METKMDLSQLVRYVNDVPNSDYKALVNGTHGAKITDSQLRILTKINRCGIIWCYRHTFADDHIRVHKYHDDKYGAFVAVEENIYGSYCIYSVNRKEILIPYSPDMMIPYVALIAVIEAMMDESDSVRADFDGFLTNGCDRDWKDSAEPSIEWTIDASLVRLTLEYISMCFKGLKSTEFSIRKITSTAECTLPNTCSDVFAIQDGLVVAKTIKEYEAAQKAVAAKRKEEAEKAEAEAQKLKAELAKNKMRQKLMQTLTEKQKLSIPKEEEVSDMVIGTWHMALSRAISNPIVPARNIILYGPPGSGKSSVAKWLAATLGIPFFPPFVCGAETTAESTKGTWRFDKDGKPVFELSNIMLCAKYGGIMEIQEIATVRDPGVMPALNNVWEPHGKIRIDETDDEFDRSPMSIYIITTNNNLAGCRPLNLSILSRMAFTFYVPALTVDEYVQRVIKSNPKIRLEEEYVKLMAKCFINLIRVVNEDGLYGDTSYRTFLSWVGMTYVMGDAQEAADYTVIDKLCYSDEAEEKDKLRSIIESMIQKKPQNVFDEADYVDDEEVEKAAEEVPSETTETTETEEKTQEESKTNILPEDIVPQGNTEDVDLGF